MGWYRKLNEYFPEHEMKHQGQLKDLLDSKDNYHKEETEDHVMLYAEFPDFIFIDYLLVTKNARGKGIGSKVLEQLKKKNKLILLEAEPRDPQSEDTQKRLDFYRKNGFSLAERIDYCREDESGESFVLKVLYWSPDETDEKEIMNRMQRACTEIHNYQSKKYYGGPLADPDEVLDWKEKEGTGDKMRCD